MSGFTLLESKGASWVVKLSWPDNDTKMGKENSCVRHIYNYAQPKTTHMWSQSETDLIHLNKEMLTLRKKNNLNDYKEIFLFKQVFLLIVKIRFRSYWWPVHAQGWHLFLRKYCEKTKQNLNNYAKFWMHVHDFMVVHNFNGGSQSGCCLHR